MKKILFLSLMAVTVLTGRSYAQQNALVAVLTHEGTNTTFHGAGALAEANEAAVDGDVITLSGGDFYEITVSKGITIRGAGMFRNEETDVDRTRIAKLTITDSTENVTLENMDLAEFVTGKHLHYISLFKILTRWVNVYEGSDMSLTNCLIVNQLNCYVDAKVAVMNSLVFSPLIDTNDVRASFMNCVVEFSHQYHCPIDQKYASYENCILYCESFSINWTVLPLTVSAKNNLGWKYSGGYPDYNLFANMTNATNVTKVCQQGDFFPAIFTNVPNVGFADSYTYELTDEAKATYIGSDGTEIGIYGGLYPFDSKPHHPIITKSNVARKAENGKLSVSFEVNGDE